MTQTTYTGTAAADSFSATGESAKDTAVFRGLSAGDVALGGAGADRFSSGGGASENGGGGADQFNIVLGNTAPAASDSIDGGSGTDTLIITASSYQLTSAVQAEFARLAIYLGGDTTQHFTSALLGINLVNVEIGQGRIDGVIQALGGLVAGPTAGADTYSGTEDQVLSVAAPLGLLTNDSSLGGTLHATAGTFATTGGGSVAIAGDGSFTYTAASYFSGLDGFSYTVTDQLGHSATGTVALDIAHVNHAATIGGATAGDVTEFAALTTAGTLTITDPDTGEAAFQAPATLAGTYGSFTFDATSGAWTYALNGTDPTVIGLGVGNTLTDTLSVASLDGTATQAVTVTIHGGHDDAPVLGTPVATVAAPHAGTSLVTLQIAGTDDDSAALSAVIDWGDGTTDTVALTAAGGGGFAGPASHAYAAGSYTASVTLSDGYLSSNAETLGIQVGTDRQNGAIALVSTAADGTSQPVGQEPNQDPVFTPDGSHVLFSATGYAINPAYGVSFDARITQIQGGQITAFIWQKDLATGAITALTTNPDGTLPFGRSYEPAISPDGGTLAFVSTDPGIADGTYTPTASQIVLKDLHTGAYALLSVAPDGTRGNNASTLPSFSADGSKLVFVSAASNLVAGDTNGNPDVFVADLTTGAITRVDTAADGTQAIVGANNPVFSPDGSEVAFVSGSANLIPGTPAGTVQIYVKNLVTGAVTLASAAADGTAANSLCLAPVFSPDGHSVAFVSSASNLIPGGSHVARDLYVKNLDTGAITMVDTAADGTPANFGVIVTTDPHGLLVNPAAAFSADGHTIYFASTSLNLGAGIPSYVGIRPTAYYPQEIYAKNLDTGAVTMVTTAADGTAASYGGAQFSLSPDGSKLLFGSVSTNLVPVDRNGGLNDIFVKTLSSHGYALTGTAGTDVLTGGALDDTLAGGAGDDILRGNLGADTFVFGPATGHATVLDFSHADHDTIALNGIGGLGSYADVMAAATQVGADTVISTGAGSITLAGVLKAGLVAGDFAFA